MLRQRGPGCFATARTRSLVMLLYHRTNAGPAMNKMLAVLVVMSAAGISAAPNLTGTWSITMDPDFRGNPAVIECTVRQQRAALTVKCGDGVEMKGELQGRKATWRTPPMTENQIVATYIADTNVAGTTLEGRWTLVGGVLNEKGKFRGKKRR